MPFRWNHVTYNCPTHCKAWASIISIVFWTTTPADQLTAGDQWLGKKFSM